MAQRGDASAVLQVSISSFKIGSLVGKGGFGSVYRGIWEGIEVAIKQCHLENLEGNLLQEFINEAKIMHKCRHPNIVLFFAICIKQAKDSLIMEYLPNGSLFKNLSDSSVEMPWFPLRWNISLDIARGLNYLHSQNIIHQDMKSMNILIDKNWKAKISDFGLSTIKSTIVASMGSLNKNKIGSIRWNAPELFKRGSKRSKETDVYSFGMTLWEISSRKIPFYEDPDDVVVISFIKDGEKENIPEDCPLPFSQIITKCWNSNPNERPSVSDVIVILEKNIDLLESESLEISSKYENTRNTLPQTSSDNNNQIEEKERKILEEKLRQEEERRKLEEEKLKLELERKSLEEERRKQEEERRIMEEERKQLVEARKRLEEERRRRQEEEERMKIEMERKRIEEERRRQELGEGRLKLELERKSLEEERIKQEEERRIMEEERKQLVEARKRLEEERKRKEEELRQQELKKQEERQAELKRQEEKRKEEMRQRELKRQEEERKRIEESKKSKKIFIASFFTLILAIVGIYFFGFICTSKVDGFSGVCSFYPHILTKYFNGAYEYERAIYLINSGYFKESIPLFYKSADLNYPPSFLWLYSLLEEEDEKQNWKLIAESNFNWYESKAQDGNPDSLFNLGYCFYKGIGTEINFNKAAVLYSKAAEQGLASAQNNLGVCYQYAEGVPKDLNRAIELFTKAAERGHAGAQYNLGNCYRFGVPKDMKKAAEFWSKAAKQGLASAQFYLGLCYQHGKGVPKDLNRAAELYTKAAEQGHASAQFYLGICHENGRGVPKDMKKAAEFYTKAAEQGHARAQFYLGLCYYNGEGVLQDMNRAVELYTKAAEQGHARAQFYLGLCYQYGKGVPKDIKKAIEFYNKAAEQGHASAQCSLGFFYENEEGVPKDIKKAIEFYTKAAQQGHASAISALHVIKNKQ